MDLDAGRSTEIRRKNSGMRQCLGGFVPGAEPGGVLWTIAVPEWGIGTRAHLTEVKG